MYCIGPVCFIPLPANVPTIFGFSEFLTGLALMVVAWTIADVRYRFRVRTAPLPIERLSFWVVAAVGTLTLLTDLWRSERWLVPEGPVLTPAGWQALLASVFLVTFLSWVWFAIVRPPVFGRLNAKRYAHTLYQTILKGAPSELSVIADECARSMPSLVSYAVELHHPSVNPTTTLQVSPTQMFATDIIQLIADKRFCRTIVESSPILPLVLFQEMKTSGKHYLPIRPFARNLFSAAIADMNSFLFNETHRYDSGLLGDHKPLTQAMFGDYELVEDIGALLDPPYHEVTEWNAEQWRAYCRVALMALEGYASRAHHQHSYVFYGVKENLGHALSDVYRVNNRGAEAWEHPSIQHLRLVVDFITKAADILDSKGVPSAATRRHRGQQPQESFYDHLAQLAFEAIFSASYVQSDRDLCWMVQHNMTWGRLFNFSHLKGPAGRVVKLKVRRLLYDAVTEMTQFPNFKGAKILAFCLNVMGLKPDRREYYRDSYALHCAIISWTKRYFAWLHGYNERVAAACLVDGTSYEPATLEIVKTYPVEGLRRRAEEVRLKVGPALPPDGPVSSE